MCNPAPISLTQTQIAHGTGEFAMISGWPYADAYVTDLLREDLPQRMLFGHCRVWLFHDPNGVPVGFGSLVVCPEYGQFTGNVAHPYIPLLAVNPTIKSKGYGTSILRYLIDEAALLVQSSAECHDVLFLDVYTTNIRGINLYTNGEFQKVLDVPIPDADYPGKEYWIMTRRVP